MHAVETVAMKPVPPDEDSKKRSIDTESMEATPSKKPCDESTLESSGEVSPAPVTQHDFIDLCGSDSDPADNPTQPTPYICPTLDEYMPNLIDLDQSKHDAVHFKIEKAKDKCFHLLTKAKEFINEEKLHQFCPAANRVEWTKEIDELMKQDEPEIVIGCLGGTGVGKSSLLKALLHEDNILPTSSSRGCTAAAVELKFNRDFAKPKGKIAVYRGQVDFISLQDWVDELELLIDDCCSQDAPTISRRRKEENEDSAAAWSKIDSVYGRGTMKSYDGQNKDFVFKALSEDERVVQLLRAADGQQHNVVEVTEGHVQAAEAQLLLQLIADPKAASDKKLARQKKRWAESFRKKINSYVYRKGNGQEPQTWPLIRKVVLKGPWNVLSTGACLVDLPGVRDDNAARAKVAEKYLQNCTKMWIVAPIKRAVDDKTAKDLLGEEFKRRLLMDGNYSNVSFVCTHSDDCEISEIIHDHEGEACILSRRKNSCLVLPLP